MPESEEGVFSTSGLHPTEFDVTTDRVLTTIYAAGTTSKQIVEAQDFVCDLLMMVGKNHPSIPEEETIECLDIAFIGLLVHRHMPYKDAETGRLFRPDIADNDYGVTLTNLVNVIIQGLGVGIERVAEVVTEGGNRAVRHMRPPDSFDDDGVALHAQVVALFVIGLLTHRLMPTTPYPPQEQ
jgi:hypothetical protein